MQHTNIPVGHNVTLRFRVRHSAAASYQWVAGALRRRVLKMGKSACATSAARDPLGYWFTCTILAGEKPLKQVADAEL